MTQSNKGATLGESRYDYIATQSDKEEIMKKFICIQKCSELDCDNLKHWTKEGIQEKEDGGGLLSMW